MDKTKELLSMDGERLDALSRDDDWLEAFIRDTEENRMLHAPARLKTNTLTKAERLRSSKRVQLISYSIKVCTAAAAALFILFTTPFFLNPYLYPEALPSVPAQTGQQTPGPAGTGMARTRQTLREGFLQLTSPLYDLSNELFPGR